MNTESNVTRQTYTLFLMIEAFVGNEPFCKDPARHKLALENSAEFTRDQLRELPGLLGTLSVLGLKLVQIWGLTFFFRPFTSMALSDRQQMMHFWAEGPVGPLRKYSKLIQSLGLIAYYDDFTD